MEKYGLPLFYVNHVGAQTELIFDGGSLVFNKDAVLVDELAYFKEDLRVYDLDQLVPLHADNSGKEASKMELIHDALVLGIRNYFDKLGFKKAILGLSGGIDSAVTHVLAARALGPENVRAILLPSQFSSDHSVNDARELAENLQTPYDINTIQSS